MDDKKHPTPSQGSHGTNDSAPEPEKPNLKAPVGKRTRTTRSRRWLYPALYLGAAAVIIGLVYAKTQFGGAAPAVSPNAIDTNTTAPTTAAETFVWPVGGGTGFKVSLGYFEPNGSASEQAAALVKYDNSYYAHQGIDIKSDTAAAFNVTAALSGQVTKVEKNPLYGETVEISSPGGYVEKYESLGDVSVKQGEDVSQGEAIGTSGTCQFEEGQGNHLYFQVNQDGKVQNPMDLLPKL
ncbi:MAG: M23 family metallopeptidase [Alicyclobacillaceae bacterium]|jgi:stage II sporulation protein Q|uniref:M23 family metallopeptidase n=1 Tax=Alicyclobacillus sp. SP_1 TaxID=2942475 RepID=UPI002157F0BF|nr:M23 family metallopeptidase [Alicyclobacillus sp. SP_1]MCY0888726.1 M23 family metallopeptidase [Alicyclobacillaceae bacterium]MCY0896588.1 M23 family metallopeptidase [Alicyclobacillaceae bacterium]